MLNYVLKYIRTSVLDSFQPNPSPHPPKKNKGACQTLPQEAESTTSLPLTKAPLPAPPSPVPVEAKAEAKAELKPALRRKSEEVKDRTGEPAKQLKGGFCHQENPEAIMYREGFKELPIGNPLLFWIYAEFMRIFCFGDGFERGDLEFVFWEKKFGFDMEMLQGQKWAWHRSHS